MRLMVLRVGIIIIMAVLTGFTVHHRQIYPLLQQLWQAQDIHLAENYAPRPVELAFVRQWQQDGGLLVDARSTDNYAAGHLADAFSLPAGDQYQLRQLVDCCVRRGAVVVYCSSITCSDSFIVGEALYVAGFNDIYLYEAGFDDWQRQRQAVIVDSLESAEDHL